MERLSPNNEWRLCMYPEDSRIQAIEVIVGIDGADEEDDNVDVSVLMANGVIHQRVFITPKNVATLLQRWSKTGECSSGAYLNGAGLVIVPRLTKVHIETAVLALTDNGIFD